MYLAAGKIDKAKAVVSDALRDTKDHRTFFDIRSRLAYSENDFAGAEGILREGLAQYRDDSVLKTHLSQLVQGKGLRLRSIAYGKVTPEPADQLSSSSGTTPQIQRSGRLRRIWGKVSARGAIDAEERSRIEKELIGILSEDKHSSFGNFIFETVSGEQLVSNSNAPFELAFARALNAKDKAAFDKLGEDGSRQLVDVAKLYLFGDRAAAERTAAWLRQRPSHEQRKEFALRSLITMRLGASIVASADGLLDALLNTVPANDNVYLDLVDAAFIPNELALAA